MTLYLSTVAGAALELAEALPTSRLTIRCKYPLEPESSRHYKLLWRFSKLIGFLMPVIAKFQNNCVTLVKNGYFLVLPVFLTVLFSVYSGRLLILFYGYCAG